MRNPNRPEKIEPVRKDERELESKSGDIHGDGYDVVSRAGRSKYDREPRPLGEKKRSGFVWEF